MGSLLNQLPSLLSSVSGLITPTLVTNLTDILGSAHELLTPTFVSQTTGLINDVAPVSDFLTLDDFGESMLTRGSSFLRSRKSFLHCCLQCLGSAETRHI